MLYVSRRHPPATWTPLRGAAAIATVVVFLGSAALAPFSVSGAFANPKAANQTGVDHTRTGSQQLIPESSAMTVLNTDIVVTETKSGTAGTAGDAEYTLAQFMFTGAVNWRGYRFTFYSQQVLPGPGLNIPGRHVNADGYVSDADGFIVLAGSAPKGTVFDTPFGYRGKIYDRGTFGNHLDVYIR